MPKPSLRDGERVPSSTQIHESNAKLLGIFLWTTVFVFVLVFLLVGDRLHVPHPEQAVSLLLNVSSVVMIVAFTWPLTYRLVSGWRSGNRNSGQASTQRPFSVSRDRRHAVLGEQEDVDNEERERVSEEVDVHVNAD